jgi:signal transduction histidine kinase
MICIKDFGKGFDTKLIQQEGHYGLRNMQKRAASVNAELHIIATAEQGTAITIQV